MVSRVVLGPGFKKCVKDLKKHYRNAGTDFVAATKAIREDPRLGVVVQGTQGIRKLRVRNSSAQTGTRGGFRLIYYYDPDTSSLYLLFAYSKNQTSDIRKETMIQLLQEAVLAE